jgi:L-rhamnose mutarotase
MMQTLIRYQTKPEKIEENKRLIQDVFRELHAAAPEGVRYATFSDDDGNFFHLVTAESDDENPIPKLAAFQRFQAEIRDRCASAPAFHEVEIVGNYRALGDLAPG